MISGVEYCDTERSRTVKSVAWLELMHSKETCVCGGGGRTKVAGDRSTKSLPWQEKKGRVPLLYADKRLTEAQKEFQDTF